MSPAVLISFEGPRKSGKTTLASMFSTKTNIPLWKRPLQVQNFKADVGRYDLFALYETSLLSLIDWSKNDLILDRHPVISEVVYSAVRNLPTPVCELDYFPKDPRHSIIFYIVREDSVQEEKSHYQKLMYHLHKERGYNVAYIPNDRTIDFAYSCMMEQYGLLQQKCRKSLQETVHEWVGHAT